MLGDLESKEVGEGAWSVIHTVSKHDRDLALWLYKQIYDKFLCLECREHFKQTYDANNPQNSRDLFRWSYDAHLKANQHSGRNSHPTFEQVKSMYDNKTMQISKKLLHGVCFMLLYVAYICDFDEMSFSRAKKIIQILSQYHPCQKIRFVLDNFKNKNVYTINDLEDLMYDIYEYGHRSINSNYKSFDEIDHQYRTVQPCSSCGGGSDLQENTYRDEDY